MVHKEHLGCVCLKTDTAFRIRRSYSLYYGKKDAEATYSDEIESTEDEFLEYKSFCSRNNITCLVYLIPNKIQILRDNMEIADKYGIPKEKIDFLWPQKHFIKFFKENNITYYDLTDEFINQNNIDSLFLPINGHWSKRGCFIAGNYLGEKLLSEGKI